MSACLWHIQASFIDWHPSLPPPSSAPPLNNTQVAGYSGLLLAAPTVLYEVIAYVVPGLTKSERKFLAPIVFGSSILFYLGCVRVCVRVSMLYTCVCCGVGDVAEGRATAIACKAGHLSSTQVGQVL